MTNFVAYTVLIVDDMEDLRESISFDFRRKGFTVLTAASGREAYKILHQIKVHAVVTDQNMPDGTGSWLIEQIVKETKVFPKFFLITGDSASEEVNKVIPYCARIFQKPFSTKDLMNAVLNSLKLEPEE